MSTYGYLIHHGIKGQRWGLRRYQNSDGTLTEAGKRRYGVSGLNGPISPNEFKREYKSLNKNLKKGLYDDLSEINNNTSFSKEQKKEVRKEVLKSYAGYGAVTANTLKKKYGDKTYKTLVSMNMLSSASKAVMGIITLGLGAKLVKDINEDYAITDRRNIYSYQAETIPEVIKREIGF